MQDTSASLYTRLGGYDAIAAVVDDLLPRLRSDALLSRFWTSPRSVDTLNRERQLAVDFIAAAAGGPTIYLAGT
jgi:hemoglobin